MKYKVNSILFDTSWEATDYIIEKTDLGVHVYEIINSLAEPMTIGLVTFYPAEVLEELDPMTYRETFENIVNELKTDTQYSLENQETDSIQGFKIEYIKEEK